jgi:hypothetical protein
MAAQRSLKIDTSAALTHRLSREPGLELLQILSRMSVRQFEIPS